LLRTHSGNLLFEQHFYFGRGQATHTLREEARHVVNVLHELRDFYARCSSSFERMPESSGSTRMVLQARGMYPASSRPLCRRA